MTASVQLEHLFEPPLYGFGSSDGKPVAITTAEVRFEAGMPVPETVLRGFGLKADGSVGGARRVAALGWRDAWEALPAEVRETLSLRASEEALELAAHLE